MVMLFMVILVTHKQPCAGKSTGGSTKVSDLFVHVFLLHI